VVALRRWNGRFRVRVPDILIVLVLTSLIVWAFGWAGNGHAVVDVVGPISGSLPSFELPRLDRGDWIRQLYLSPLAIALLGLVESLAIAKSIAARTRQSLDYNRQCLAEGLANIGGSMFRCMPGSGSLTRSALNFQAGAATRMSGVISAIAVALILVTCAPLAQYVPKAALAAILVVTAWGLVDRRRLRYCMRASRFDAGLALATAFVAIFVGIEMSILVGIFLSFMFFVPRAARLQASELVVGPGRVLRERLPDDVPCNKLVILAFEGEMFFGAAPELQEHLAGLARRAQEGVRVMVLRLKRARNPDMVCMELLQRFLVDMHERGVTVFLCGIRDDFAAALARLRFHHWFPREQLFLEEPTVGSSTLHAVRSAYEILGSDLCATCPRAGDKERETGDWYYTI
jgi:SulP family sulfate permease